MAGAENSSLQIKHIWGNVFFAAQLILNIVAQLVPQPIPEADGPMLFASQFFSCMSVGHGSVYRL